MIFAFDTYYFDNKANTVCISFDNWNEEENYKVYAELKEGIEEYMPGKFYQRELPCIISLLKKIDIDKVAVIIVDGFVYLDDDYKLGLGGHLYEALDRKIPVIGVAKSNFATIVKCKKELLRGESKNPLFITSIGIDVDIATELIKNMNGEFRMPALLKELDRLTKDKILIERPMMQ